MRSVFLDDNWHVEANTKEFGKILLLDENESFLKPVTFQTEEEANNYIEYYIEKHPNYKEIIIQV